MNDRTHDTHEGLDPATTPTIVSCVRAGRFDTDIGPEAILKNCERCKVGIWVAPSTFQRVTGPKILMCAKCANKDFAESPGSMMHPAMPEAVIEALLIKARRASGPQN